MGGNTFYQPRLPRDAYLTTETHVRQVLPGLFGTQWRIPAYHADKADFGDLDVMIASSALTTERLQAFGTAVGATDYRRHNVGHSFLTPVPGDPHGRLLQVDLFGTPDDLLHTRATFMGWGDFGNILGRLLKPLGLRWGEVGLEYVHRVPGDDHWKRLHLVSRDIDTALHVAGLDPATYHAGFASERAMHDYLRASPLFSGYPFLNPGSRLNRKTITRPGMTRFITYLRDLGTPEGEHAPTWSAEQTDAALPGYGILAFAQAASAEHARLARLKQHVNGHLVMTLTGRTGRDLGNLMRALKPDTERLADLYERGQTAEADAIILTAHRTLP